MEKKNMHLLKETQMIKTDIIERRYWSMGQAAEQLGIPTTKIKFWSDIGLIPTKKKPHHSNPKWKERYFDTRTFNQLKIVCGLRTLGVEIKLIRQARKEDYAQELLDYLIRMR